MLMSMFMLQVSVDFFVLSFVLLCAYAYVASEDQTFPYDGICLDSATLNSVNLWYRKHFPH